MGSGFFVKSIKTVVVNRTSFILAVFYDGYKCFTIKVHHVTDKISLRII